MKTYCIDIDGTICNSTFGAYGKAEPFQKRIDKINQLYDQGHKIIYFTARGMNRFNGDVTQVKEILQAFTIRQLESWGCKYHELIMGKPSYDYIIDDKNIDPDEYFDGTTDFKGHKLRFEEENPTWANQKDT